MEAEEQKLSSSSAEIIDRIKGCIYGCALGDAFGLSTEFMTKVTARHLYGVGPIKFGTAEGFEFWRDGHRRKWNECDFTDDTDQLLLILQCLLQNGGILNPKHFAFRLLEWTKVGFPELEKPPCGIGFTVGSVLSHPEFLNNPHRAAYQIWDRNERNLAANGAVMRTAVLGIPFFWDEKKVVQNAISAAKVTHADPRSIISALIVSVIVSRMLGGATKKFDVASIQDELNQQILRGKDLESKEETGTDTEGELELRPKVVETKEKSGLLGKIANFFKKEDKTPMPQFKFPEYNPCDRSRGETPVEVLSSPEGMDTFGHDSELSKLCHDVVNDYRFLLSSSPFYRDNDEPNWVTELESHCFPNSIADLKLSDKPTIGYTFKCLGAGIYALTRVNKEESTEKFFKTIITELTLEAGDSDTNCAVAGALLGVRLGYSGLPQDWLEGLRHSQFLNDISNELCDLVLEELRK